MRKMISLMILAMISVVIARDPLPPVAVHHDHDQEQAQGHGGGSIWNINLISPDDGEKIGTRILFKWSTTPAKFVVEQTSVTYIFLNGRKHALLAGTAQQEYESVLEPGEYEWQVLVGTVYPGGSHLDLSSIKRFRVGDYQEQALIVGNSGITVEGADRFQIVVGAIPHRSSKFSPILDGGEWWNYHPTRSDTLWFKAETRGRWYPSIDGKAMYGPILADTLMVNDLTAKMQKMSALIESLPTAYAIAQNYPNPFNPTTTIEFVLPEASEVTLKVFNVSGQEVASLVNSRFQAGYHKVAWDAANNAGGLYIVEMKASNFVQTMKMVLAK